MTGCHNRRYRLFRIAGVVPFAVLTALAGLATPAARADSHQEIIASRDAIARWVKQGTAAGYQGDEYDNRDGGHSRLPVQFFPGLSQVPYTDEQRKRTGWGLQLRVRPQVTVGNSSTAGRRHYGSHARTCYTIPQTLGIAYLQYRGNNLYVYPEHYDHDPPVDGKGGSGDVIPGNTPYILVSQGSSGSDKPLIRAVAFTLGAFRPEVKQLLTKRGLLMPTVQMIFRTCNKHIDDPSEYLTGKAHPTVFQGDWTNPVKMIEMAHAIRTDVLPPMVQLRVVDEDVLIQGRDFFEGRPRSETVADTPCAIARVFRGKQYRRRIVLSAEDSYDLSGRPLKYRWVVLRGDADRIRIVPKNPQGSIVELSVPYHAQQLTEWEPKIPSSRVDIGVFVHNGTYYSAPGFVTYYSLTNEKREYLDDGRVKQIDYGSGVVFDNRLTDHKPWRDVYEYSPQNTLTGWTRYYTDNRIQRYTAEGLLVLARGADGRPTKTAAVAYRGKRDGRDVLVINPEVVGPSGSAR